MSAHSASGSRGKGTGDERKRNVPILEQYPYQQTMATKEKFMSGVGTLIDNCYYHRIVDNVLYEVLDLKNQGYPVTYIALLAHSCQFLKMMNHPTDVIVGFRITNPKEHIRQDTGVAVFEYALFDAKTHMCYCYGERSGIQVQITDEGKFKKSGPMIDRFYQGLLQLVPKEKGGIPPLRPVAKL